MEHVLIHVPDEMFKDGVDAVYLEIVGVLRLVGYLKKDGKHWRAKTLKGGEPGYAKCDTYDDALVYLRRVFADHVIDEAMGFDENTLPGRGFRHEEVPLHQQDDLVPDNALGLHPRRV